MFATDFDTHNTRRDYHHDPAGTSRSLNFDNLARIAQQMSQLDMRNGMNVDLCVCSVAAHDASFLICIRAGKGTEIRRTVDSARDGGGELVS